MKRHPSLKKLSSDHHHGLVYSKKLISAAGKTLAEAEEIFEMFSHFFNSELHDHFAEEENYLTPYFKNNPLIERMQAEHKNMKAVFDVLKIEGSNLREGLAAIGKMLNDHIRFEEKELFPMIEKTLSESELDEIGKKLK
jgi:hemerythrin-like domain-containing protein